MIDVLRVVVRGVRDLRNPRHVQYYTCSAENAVIAAYAQSLNDWNTWDYRKRYAHLVEETPYHFFCGDFACSKLEISIKKA